MKREEKYQIRITIIGKKGWTGFFIVIGAEEYWYDYNPIGKLLKRRKSKEYE